MVQVATNGDKLVIGLVQDFDFGGRQHGMVADVGLDYIAHDVVHTAFMLFSGGLKVGAVFFWEADCNPLIAFER